MTIRVRFAPSPTGFLHVGNARVALLNWLLARQAGGVFVLRMDDTDLDRSTIAFADGIRADLAWLGLVWDEEFAQSRRLDLYAEAARKLTEMGRLYACYETPDELDFKRKLQLSRGLPPVYDRAALKLTAEQKSAFEAEGRSPHWRFKLDHEDVTWTDLVRGECRYHGSHISDPVLIRGDGTPLYTLPSVLDDMDMNITHVMRGEDHVTNTAAQVQIFRALGAEPPAFAHLPLMTDISGKGLSKRLGSLSLKDMRADGIEAMAINSLLAKLGSSDPVEPRAGLDALVAEFDIAKFARGTPKFDPAELDRLNAAILRDLPYEAVAERLDDMAIGDADEAFWLAVRGNLAKFAEAKDWWKVCREPVAPIIEDAEMCSAAALLLPPEPWDETTWGAFTNEVKQATGRKGKALFHPLRLALTGRDNGPELKALLPLIGRARAASRLNGETA